MARPRHLVVTLAGSLALGSAAAAQPLETAGATTCDVRAFANDSDPRGTNVRSAPRADAPIIGRLAPLTRIERDTLVGVEFDIVGSKNGWLLIRNGRPEGGLTFDAAHAADGRGWISGRLAATTLALPAFRSAPRRDAPQIARMMGDFSGSDGGWGPYSVAMSAVHGCQGGYIEVTVTPPRGKPVRGWSFKPCAAQLTTCDGGMPE
jgi:hypothetical protein